jgi:hypothetical protein
MSSMLKTFLPTCVQRGEDVERIGGVEGGVVKVVGKIGREKSCCEVTNLMYKVSLRGEEGRNEERA